MRQVIGWSVFYIVDLYDVGGKQHQVRMHHTRAEARNQMRGMKAQPWTFSSVFMCRVVLVNGNMRYEKAR